MLADIEERISRFEVSSQIQPDVPQAWRKGGAQRRLRWVVGAGGVALFLGVVGSIALIRSDTHLEQPVQPGPDRFSYNQALTIGTEYQPQALLPGGQGWYTTHTEPPEVKGIQDQNWAWSSTERFVDEINDSPHPERSLKKLSRNGVFVTASATLAVNEDGTKLEGLDKYERLNLPLRLSRLSFSKSYEGQGLQRQRLWEGAVLVDDYLLHVAVHFGSHPTQEMQELAQSQLDGLYIRPPLMEVAYNGTPLPDEVTRQSFVGGSIELPKGWLVKQDVTTPPANFIVTNYESSSPNSPCEGSGWLRQMPSDGVAIVVYENPGVRGRPKPQHVVLDPTTFAPYEGWGCHPAYRIDFSESGSTGSVLVFFRDDDPSPQSLALVLRAIDSLEID